jgi:MFS family permease
MMRMMLTGRLIQGAAAGGIVILVNICISDLFTARFFFAYHKIHETGLPSAD